MDKKHIILSAGGTGGHIMPAQALTQDLISRGFAVSLVTDARGSKYTDLFGDIDVHVVRAGTMGEGVFGKIGGVMNLGLGFLKAMKILAQIKPAVVIGFGGYPSMPAMIAAQRMKIPTIIHEQNAIIGRANAYLANKAERIALSLPAIQGLDKTDQMRTVITGNPVRPDIAALYTKPYPAMDQGGAFEIFVMGGSLGASVLSRVVPESLAMLSGEYRTRLRVTQQCREEDLESVRAVYNEAGIEADLAPFFSDVAAKMEKSHLIIARSGASTVAEVAVAGRPAIFVPLDIHKDQQQKMNADSIADASGAWVMAESGFTPETLLARIETFLQNPESLFKAAENARSCGKPDAARKLGNLVTAIASGWG